MLQPGDTSFEKKVKELNTLCGEKAKIPTLTGETLPKDVIESLSSVRSSLLQLPHGNGNNKEALKHRNPRFNEAARNAVKKSMYSHVGWFIERMWKKYFLQKERVRYNVKTFKIFYEEDVEMSTMEMEEAMYLYLFNLSLDIREELIASTHRAYDDIEFDESGAKILRNYMELLDHGSGVDHESIKRHIIQGLNTSLSLFWGIIAILPQVYYQEFEKYPDADTYIKLIKNSKPFTAYIAQSGVDVLSMTMAELIDFEKQEYYQMRIDKNLDAVIHVFDPAKFTFKKKNRQSDDLYLTVTTETCSSLQLNEQDHDGRKELVLGCPVMKAQGVHKTTVFDELYDEIVDLSQDFVVVGVAECLEKEHKSTPKQEMHAALEKLGVLLPPSKKEFDLEEDFSQSSSGLWLPK